MSFIKKNWSNILFGLLVILLLVPQTGKPIKVFINRLFSFSPKELKEEKQEALSSFDWQLLSLDNQQLNFADLKGKVVLVNFWATWCPPCIAEMPSLQKLYDKHGDEVVFILVSDEEPNKLRQFLSKMNYSMPVYNPISTRPSEFESTSIPTTFLLNKEGKIVISEVGSADWDSKKVNSIVEKLKAE